jgi:hypothetical protein
MRRLSTVSMKSLCKSTDDDGRETAYKIVAYSAVSCSILAIMTVAFTMPIVYNFIDHIQQQTKRELSICKVCLISRTAQNTFLLSLLLGFCQGYNGRNGLKTAQKFRYRTCSPTQRNDSEFCKPNCSSDRKTCKAASRDLRQLLYSGPCWTSGFSGSTRPARNSRFYKYFSAMSKTDDKFQVPQEDQVRIQIFKRIDK